MAINPLQPPTLRQRQEAERPTPLRVPQQVAVTNVLTTNTTLYTVPTDRYFLLTHMGVAALSATNLAVSVHLVPDGGAAGAGNKVYDQFIVWPQTSEALRAINGHLLAPGDKIIVVTDDGTNGGNFWLWGEEIIGWGGSA